jgi:hypothetical protein
VAGLAATSAVSVFIAARYNELTGVNSILSLPSVNAEIRANDKSATLVVNNQVACSAPFKSGDVSVASSTVVGFVLGGTSATLQANRTVVRCKNLQQVSNGLSGDIYIGQGVRGTLLIHEIQVFPAALSDEKRLSLINNMRAGWGAYY